jgi:hypothetical protein
MKDTPRKCIKVSTYMLKLAVLCFFYFFYSALIISICIFNTHSCENDFAS